MDVYTAIRTRRDMEAFGEECPPRAAIERMIEAATWAPNHRMTEPWRFYVVSGEGRERLGDAIGAWLAASGGPEGAQRSARAKLMRAPVTVFVSQAGPLDDVDRALEDYAACAAAVQNLLLAAHEEGLIAHLSTDRMITYERTRECLGLDPGARIVAMVNVGFLRADTPRKEGQRSAPLVTWDWA